MKNSIILVLILLLAELTVGQTKTHGTVAFIDVNVIPMDRERLLRNQTVIVRDGRIMAGSDTPEWLMLYGHTLHLELIDLRDAGLSNYAALETATRNPALFFGTTDKTGTIGKGKRADLVLLDANPLEDIVNTQKRAGVMIKGKYYSQAEMNQWLDEIAPRFQHALDEKN